MKIRELAPGNLFLLTISAPSFIVRESKQEILCELARGYLTQQKILCEVARDYLTQQKIVDIRPSIFNTAHTFYNIENCLVLVPKNQKLGFNLRYNYQNIHYNLETCVRFQHRGYWVDMTTEVELIGTDYNSFI